MTLPYDFARCHGSNDRTACFKCVTCARTDKGREEYQAYILPAIDLKTLECPNYIKREVKNDRT